MVPGTSLAIAKRTLALVSPVFTAPSEKTVKLTLGGLFTVTAGTPAACSTVKAEAEFVAESLPATAPAATMVSLSVVPVLAGGARLVQLASGAAVTVDNARFVAAPWPVVLHVIGYLMCLREPRWLDLWIQKVSRCPRVKNYAHWRCNSYSP